jgi:hypothetical protein
MALIICPECKGSVSDTAENCPHCGFKIKPEPEKNKSGLQRELKAKDIFILLIWCVVIIGILVYLASGTSKTETTKEPEKIVTPAPPQNSSQIKPEMVVKFPTGGLACLTREGLEEALIHGFKGEKTKFNSQFLSKNNPNGECVPLYPNKKYKIISAEYNDPNMPETAILEIVGAGINNASRGAFTIIVSNEMIQVIK